MKLAALNHWETTRDSLHRASQVVGAFRKVSAIPDPVFFQHHALAVIPQGLDSQSIPLEEIYLDFGRAVVSYQGYVIPLAGHSQASLAAALLDAVQVAGHDPQVNLASVADTSPLQIDPQHGADYAAALWNITQTMAAFREGLPGFKTPLVVFPHHFDLSFLWFPGDHQDEHQPHLNFGFAPFSEGYPRPYFYTYAYPVPAGYREIILPEGVSWAQPWTGTVQLYDDLAKSSDPLGQLTASLKAIYAASAALLTA
jgi:hypothetical protein